MIFVCDIDQTIAKLTEEQKKFLDRKEVSTDKKLDWDKGFYKYIEQQKTNKNSFYILNHFLYTHHVFVVFATGRNEKYRERTKTWLRKYILSDHELYMRKDGDFRPADLIKKDHLDAIKVSFENCLRSGPIIAFDDNKECREMYKREGCFVITWDLGT